MTRRAGILSGKFDPPHEGHIGFCLKAARDCDLDEVVLLPEKNPRSRQPVNSLHTRTSLLVKMTEPYPNLRVLTLSDERFTVKDTLPKLQDKLKNAELCLLVGSDVAYTFLNRWDNLDELLASTGIVIGLRNDDSESEIRQIIKRVESNYGLSVHCDIIRSPRPELSSSQARQDKSD